MSLHKTINYSDLNAQASVTVTENRKEDVGREIYFQKEVFRLKVSVNSCVSNVHVAVSTTRSPKLSRTHVQRENLKRWGFQYIASKKF